MKLRTCTLASVTLILAFAASPLFARTWTDRKGRKVEADFVKFADGNVTIKRQSDGKVFTIRLESLSDADQSFIAQKGKPGPITKDMLKFYWKSSDNSDQGLRFYDEKVVLSTQAVGIVNGMFAFANRQTDIAYIIDPKTNQIKFDPDRKSLFFGVAELINDGTDATLIVTVPERDLDKARFKKINPKE